MVPVTVDEETINVTRNEFTGTTLGAKDKGTNDDGAGGGGMLCISRRFAPCVTG